MMFTVKKTNYSCYDMIWHDVIHGIWHMILCDSIQYDMVMYDTQYGTYYVKPTMSKR